MKPVAEQFTHYSVLLMRDDSRARSFHVRCGLLRFWLISLLVLVLAGMGGIAASVYLWIEHYDLSGRYAQQEREMRDMRVQLEHFTNIKQLERASSGAVLSAKNEEVGASLDRLGNGNGNGNAGNGTNGTNGTTAQAANDESISAAVAVANGIGQNVQSAAQSTTDSSDVHQAQPSDPQQLGTPECPLKIDNFRATRNGPRQIRTRYNLSVNGVSDGRKTFAGISTYRATLRNGEKQVLTPVRPTSTRFSFNNLKSMDVSINLPQDKRVDDVAGIEVTVELEQSGVVYYETFPMNR